MWRGIKIKGNVHIYKNIVSTLWYEKQRNKFKYWFLFSEVLLCITKLTGK